MQFATDNGTPGTAADTLTWSAPLSFLLGTFTHVNNPVDSSSYSLVHTGFRMRASGFGIDDNALGGAAYAFGVTHTETPHSGTCANGANGSGINSNGCADKLHVDVLTPMSFTFGGVGYAMSVGFDPR